MNKTNFIDSNTKQWIRKVSIIMFMDTLIILASYLFALFVRFDFSFSKIPEEFIQGYIRTMPYYIVSTLVVMYINRLYHCIWRLASISELSMIVATYMWLVPVYCVEITLIGVGMPRTCYFIGYIFSFCLHTAMRFSYRFAGYIFRSQKPNRKDERQDRIMVIGAGAAGQSIIKELLRTKQMSTKVCCIIDDNPTKKGRVLEGVPIVGNRHEIIKKAREFDINYIIYAIPKARAADRKEILNLCQQTGCRLKAVPAIYQLVNGEVSVSRLRNVEIQELLGRAEIQVNNTEILKSIKDKVVLVTGGGGSIGSELCRQIAKSEPKKLIIFDIYENNAYDIQQELKKAYPELNMDVLIGSVRNTNRITWVMNTYRPDIVFHAAAHKHVPLMEDSPNEAIKNNVIGTYKTATAASNAGVKRFVLISTDKAVNPTNIMGASKRICEMVIQMMNRQSETEFVAVRFGNVLGSNGSVIPLFKKQIEEGGPVTVTDKRIIRYFMTIPEAVALVLQAAYYAKGGEIFVLDMGEPVKIDDLARNMIRLSGFIPDVDIKIEYTGLRPGEKLFEELLMDEEGLQATANEMIHIGQPIEMDDVEFKQKLLRLDLACKEESEMIKQIVAEMVPTYQYQK